MASRVDFIVYNSKTSGFPLTSTIMNVCSLLKSPGDLLKSKPPFPSAAPAAAAAAIFRQSLHIQDLLTLTPLSNRLCLE